MYSISLTLQAIKWYKSILYAKYYQFLISVVNCDVSKWSKWSSCDRSCGKGVQSRTRLIIQHPSPGGKRCPSLSQNRACLGNRCSAKYRKYKNPIVGKYKVTIYFRWNLTALGNLIAELGSVYISANFLRFILFTSTILHSFKIEIQRTLTVFSYQIAIWY